jgi:hypothetical protein
VANESSRPVAEAAGPRQEVTTMVAVTAAVAAVTEAPLAPAPAAVAQAAGLEIPDDDAPPPGWG